MPISFFFLFTDMLQNYIIHVCGLGNSVSPRAGLDGCGKSRPFWDLILGPSSLWRVARPTELSQPTHFKLHLYLFHSSSCLFNFSLPACRPDFAIVACTTAGLVYMKQITSYLYSKIKELTHTCCMRVLRSDLSQYLSVA